MKMRYTFMNRYLGVVANYTQTDIYEEYRDAIFEEYPSGKISYMKNYGVVCEIPNRVFLDSNNWKENGTVFRYRTNGKNPKLEATFTAGRSIFWKKR